MASKSGSNSLDFILGLHFHQPAGNFEQVLENAYNDAYLPLIRTFRKCASVKLNLHISSPLLEYFRDRHPDFLADIAEEVDKKKIEMLGGGFYEPILCSIPARDVKGQLEKMSGFLQTHLRAKPRGIWLSERVWEPNLPELLKDTGIEYLAVDDTHFIQAGYTPDMLKGYYLTDYNGNRLGIFIIDKLLRYYIPFKPVKEIIGRFREISEQNEEPLLCMIDDGEKFGVWPHTKKWVHGSGWLDKFFAALDSNSSWLRTRTLSEYYDSTPPLGKAYLPTCSYYEMLEWSMPVKGIKQVAEIKGILREKGIFDKVDPYLTGGIWRNYFAKYPESDYMHKKMLYLSNQLETAINSTGNTETTDRARMHLYRAQCNCPYWHGVFGGIYLPHLRNNIYENLNRLHSIIDNINHSQEQFIDLQNADIDCDKKEEILVNTENLFMCLRPDCGGIIEEISDKKTAFNHLNTISRKEEFYHKSILDAAEGNGRAKNRNNPADFSDGIPSIHDLINQDPGAYYKYLRYDGYPRKSLVDHIFNPDVEFGSFLSGEYQKTNTQDVRYGKDIVPGQDDVLIRLTADAGYNGNAVSLEKAIRFIKGKRGFDLRFGVKNISPVPLSFKYGIEFNFSMLTDKSGDQYYNIGENTPRLEENGSLKDRNGFGITSKMLGFAVGIEMDRPADIWYLPVSAVTNSEAGFGLTYQSSCILPVFSLELAPGQDFSLGMNYLIKDIIS
ncbi:MAG: DUF1926 domain-containing protein [Elusimicrobia bacterium]|nr:DUF1926 domain-containing protein [Elusimicrobiota bacterium]